MVVGDVELLRRVEERWGLAVAAGGAPACQIHEKLHKRVILAKNMSTVITRRGSKEHHVLGSAGSGSVQK